MLYLFTEIYWSIVDSSLEYYWRVLNVIWRELQELLFLQYVFNLTAGKECSLVKKLNYISWPSPFKPLLPCPAQIVPVWRTSSCLAYTVPVLHRPDWAQIGPWLAYIVFASIISILYSLCCHYVLDSRQWWTSLPLIKFGMHGFIVKTQKYAIYSCFIIYT